MENLFGREHTYTLVTTGLTRNISKRYSTRAAANEKMYQLVNKFHLHLLEVYDDKHYKTYKYDQNVCFYIQRAF